MSEFPQLASNKAVEDAAIAWVIEYERGRGREAHDARYTGAAGDVQSDGRVIEVKAFGKSNRGFGLWLETRQVEEARSNPSFFVYVIENVRQGDPSAFTLKILGGDRLRRLLEKARERRYFEVPWPVADYDTPHVED